MSSTVSSGYICWVSRSWLQKMTKSVKKFFKQMSSTLSFIIMIYAFYFLSSFRKYRFTYAKNQRKWSNALANVKFYPNLPIFPWQKFSHVFILEIQSLYNSLNICPWVFWMQYICSNLTIQDCSYNVIDFLRLPEFQS